MDASVYWQSEFSHGFQRGSTALFQCPYSYEHLAEQMIRVNAEILRLSAVIVDMNSEILSLKRINYELKHKLPQVDEQPSNLVLVKDENHKNNTEKSDIVVDDECVACEIEVEETRQPTVTVPMVWRRKREVFFNHSLNALLRRSHSIRSRENPNRRNKNNRPGKHHKPRHCIFFIIRSSVWDNRLMNAISNCMIFRKGIGNLRKSKALASDGDDDDDDDEYGDEMQQMGTPSEPAGGQDGRLLDL